ncbi:MAG TPA: hypothetical protein VFD58_19605 [Blastocatellia bacterium]|nr:hypothetical protein [Blastocatellia bacterium]
MRYQLLIRIVSLTIALAALAAAAAAQARTDVQLPKKEVTPVDPQVAVGPPKVQITEVRNAGVLPGDPQKLRIIVKWSAAIPSTTTVSQFTVSLNVTYSDGSAASTSPSFPASAREAVLRIPNKGGIVPNTFRALVETDFTTILTQSETFSGSFSLSKANGFADSISVQNRPEAESDRVTAVKALRQNGAFNLTDYDVFWFINQRRAGLTFTSFKVKGDFAFHFSGTPGADINQSASATASGEARQARLTLSSPPKGTGNLLRIDAAITVDAFFTVRQRAITERTGSF